MEFNLIDALGIIGSLGLFMYGIKIMSESMQKSLSSTLTKLLNVMKRNGFSGLLTGMFTSSILMSSSATIVMAVSFVNTGLISLAQSVSIMLGANIGTTFLTWLVALFGFQPTYSNVFIVIFAIGTPLLFSVKNRLKYIGEFIFGVALLFLGLSVMESFVPKIGETTEALIAFRDAMPTGIVANIFYVFVGLFLTAILQSSSVSIVFTQVLCFNGILSFEVAIPLVLGQNFGRLITTEVASLAGNVFAKRSARISSLIDISGFLWMVIAISIFPVYDAIDFIVQDVLGMQSVFTPLGGPIGIAVFHTLFNVVNAALLIWFVPYLVRLATNNVKSKGRSDEDYHLEHISSGITHTPQVSIFEAQREIAKFGEITLKMNGFVKKLITTQDEALVAELLAKTAKYEDITDKIEKEVADYLTKISQGELSEEASIRVRGMLRIIMNLERIGDIYFQMSKTIERKNKDKTWFTPDQRNGVLAMFDLVENALQNMCSNLSSSYDVVAIAKAKELENEINDYRTVLRKKHFENVEKGEYNFLSATAYSELYNSLEKVGDHIINVSEGVLGIH
jgi:phosphate:Na+ symporter